MSLVPKLDKKGNKMKQMLTVFFILTLLCCTGCRVSPNEFEKPFYQTLDKYNLDICIINLPNRLSELSAEEVAILINKDDLISKYGYFSYPPAF